MVVAQFVTGEARLTIQRGQLPDRSRLDRRCRHYDALDVLRRRFSRFTRQPRCGDIAFELHPTGDDRVARAAPRECDAAASTSTASSRSGISGSAVICRTRRSRKPRRPGLGQPARPHNPDGRRHEEDDQQHSEELKQRIAPLRAGWDQAARAPAVPPYRVGRRRRSTTEPRRTVV